ncbi:MAG TPA: FkbM family methyltransferase [Vicinamibacterales bacterium]|nr:FkbM family methyltransferase [Vicinamibacterales bacterium]
MLKRLTVLLLVIAAIAVMANSPRAFEIRKQFAVNQACCDLPFFSVISLTAREAIGARTYPSEIGQDKWVTEKIFPNVADGFFLDVGSGHGTIGSNTKALEERGWRGICVDPFPTHMEDRTCTMVREVVASASGQVVKFHTHSGLGGIADTLGKWKEEAAKSPAVELTTVTLAEVLEKTDAPSYIHFLSLDIEGAELDALKGIPFDRYRFGSMAIEHNDEEPKRTDILDFLAARGYRRCHSYKQDDFYVPATQ